MKHQQLRLHLAASRFERLEAKTIEWLTQPGWIHLGEPPINWLNEVKEQFSFFNIAAGLRIALAAVYRTFFPRHSRQTLIRLYQNSDFREFTFKAGDRLPFDDHSFTFILSEHFFEHLFLHDALSLLKECERVLRPGGVIRTSVPDADLRTYAPIEIVGYPSKRTPWFHHQKHKMRWNVYSFNAALKASNLIPHPLCYCNEHGDYIKEIPIKASDIYRECPEIELICSIDYLRRVPSLIIDGIKPLSPK